HVILEVRSFAALRLHNRLHRRRPSPPRLENGPANCGSADLDQFQSAFGKLPNLIRFTEVLQFRFFHVSPFGSDRNCPKLDAPRHPNLSHIHMFPFDSSRTNNFTQEWAKSRGSAEYATPPNSNHATNRIVASGDLTKSTFDRSATGHLLQLFRVSGAVNRDLRGSVIDVVQIVRRQFDRHRANVLVQTVQLRGARDRNNPRLLG